MDSDNVLLENIVVLDTPSDNPPWICTPPNPRSPVTPPVAALTATQIKKQFTSRLEERTRANFEKITSLSGKKVKCPDADFVMPSAMDHSGFLSYKYKKTQLQDMARFHRLLISGSVDDLTIRVYTYLSIQSYVVPFQSLWRGYLRRKCNALRGAAFMDRKKCNNDEDFLTGDTMRDVDIDQFVSYTACDGFVYGFDIVSLYNLKLNNKSGDVLNPYTREAIPPQVFLELTALLNITKKVYKIPIDVTFERPAATSPRNMTIEERVTDLFSSIETHGYYPTTSWFTDLDRPQLIRMLRELSDIFLYRASIPPDTQRRICPENPFRSISAMVNIMQSYEDIYVARDILLYAACSIVMSGIESSDRALGTIVFLQALTLVSDGARDSYPLFYESAVYT
jgi:hypothetical protein